MTAAHLPWTHTILPDGTVRFDVHVPAQRHRVLAAWAVVQAVVIAVLTTLLGASVIVLLTCAWSPQGPALVLFTAGPFVLLAPRVPGATRLAIWRFRGRETIDVRPGAVTVRRAPASGTATTTLDTAMGAFVGVVGDVDTFYVRATRWKSGRWFRPDDVPGLAVGSVRIATAGETALVGLSLTREEAAALAAELGGLPGVVADRSAVAGRG